MSVVFLDTTVTVRTCICNVCCSTRNATLTLHQVRDPQKPEIPYLACKCACGKGIGHTVQFYEGIISPVVRVSEYWRGSLSLLAESC